MQGSGRKMEWIPSIWIRGILKCKLLFYANLLILYIRHCSNRRVGSAFLPTISHLPYILSLRTKQRYLIPPSLVRFR